MYGNLLGLHMCAGDNVVWYTFGLGTEVDMHGVFFEGNTFNRQNMTRDIVNVFPHTTAVVAMQPNTPGESSCRFSTGTWTPLPRCTDLNVGMHHKMNTYSKYTEVSTNQKPDVVWEVVVQQPHVQP